MFCAFIDIDKAHSRVSSSRVLVFEDKVCYGYGENDEGDVPRHKHSGQDKVWREEELNEEVGSHQEYGPLLLSCDECGDRSDQR